MEAIVTLEARDAGGVDLHEGPGGGRGQIQ